MEFRTHLNKRGGIRKATRVRAITYYIMEKNVKTPKLAVSKEIIAHDFATSVHEKLDDKIIDETSKFLLNLDSTPSYQCNGSVIGVVFYFHFSGNVTNGKTFTGNAGGIGSIGAGALMGDIYTNDLPGLYANTVSFQFTGTPVYFSIIFFDKNSNALGTWQCGAVSIVIGTGGGSGSFS